LPAGFHDPTKTVRRCTDLAWFAREGFPRGETSHLPALMHEIGHKGLKELLARLKR
jgi:uncharacterized protein (DUF3820 family)